MAKRGADNQLTKDDVDAGLDEEKSGESGSWKPADADKIKERKIIKVKRRGEASSTAAPSATPSFTFPTASAAPTFNFGAAAATPAPNAFAALLDPTEWICANCEVRNKKELAKCKACEGPNPAGGEKKTAAPAAAFNAFTALLDPTEWVCKSCFVRNKKDLSKCKACDAPNTAATENKDAKNTAAAAPAPKFIFGVAAGDTTKGFSFGTAAAATTPFGFGAKATGWSFGNFGKDGKEDKKDGEKAPAPSFTFGSTLSGCKVATFGSIDSGKGFTGENKLDGSVASFGGATADPTKEEFKNKERESSGEEGDTRLLSVSFTKVYSLATVYEKPDAEKEEDKGKKSSKWVECGQGEVHINTYKKDGKNQARIVLRADKTQRLVLNAPIYKDLSSKTEGDKFVRISSTDLEGKPCSYLLKFKHKTDPPQVMAKIAEAVKTLLD